MQTIRLWTHSLATRIDGMVSRIENHEALARSAIQEVRGAAARARVQLRRVRADGEQLRARIEEAREAEASWRERARRKASEDEAAAIECLRRSREAARRVGVLEARRIEHERLEAELTTDVGRIQERLTHLEEHKHVLAARESRAAALSGLDVGEVGPGPIEDLFDRWEVQISEREVSFGREDDADAFEHAFSKEEEEVSLHAELATLRAESDEVTQ